MTGRQTADSIRLTLYSHRLGRGVDRSVDDVKQQDHSSVTLRELIFLGWNNEGTN